MDGNKLLKVRRRCNVTCAQADVIWPYQRNTAKCSQETLVQSPGDEAAEASIAPGVGLQGKLLRLESLALLKQNREEWPGEASRPQQKRPGLFPPAIKRKKRMIEKTEGSENNRSQSLHLFSCDNKGHMIFQPPLQLAGQRFLLAPQYPPLYSAHNHRTGLLAKV